MIPSVPSPKGEGTAHTLLPLPHLKVREREQGTLNYNALSEP